MLDSIEIKNFKRIGEEGLKLNNLKKVNYLVGENGSGKSSVLECLFGFSLSKNKSELINLTATSYWGERNIDRILPSNTCIIKLNDLKLIWNNDKYENIVTDKVLLVYNSNKSFYYRCDSEKGFYVETYGYEKLVGGQDFDFKKHKKYYEDFEKIQSRVKDLTDNRVLFDMSHHHHRFTNIFNLGYQDIAYEDINSKFKNGVKDIYFDQTIWNDKLQTYFKNEINLAEKLNLEFGGSDDSTFNNRNHYQSGGQYILLQLLQLYNLTKQKGYKYILLEEPEGMLHPKYQKIIPTILEVLSSKSNIQIIVSTHSPFIISAAGEYGDTQNIYMIEGGKCLNPDGSSGKDVKGIAATMLGAGIEDLTPSTVVFCAQSEKEFLERINKKWYFKDILFRTPSNGGDSHLNNMAYIEDIFKFGGDFFPNAQILYYRDCFDLAQKTDKDMKQKHDNNKEFRKKLILSTESSFEAKFGEDSKMIGGENGIGKVKNSINHAERLISIGEAGKNEFEDRFPELKDLFGFEAKNR